MQQPAASSEFDFVGKMIYYANQSRGAPDLVVSEEVITSEEKVIFACIN